MKEYFENVGKVEFTNDKFQKGLCFRHYNANEVVGGKSMREQLKFSMAFWQHHVRRRCGTRLDPGTAQRPWKRASSPMGYGEGTGICGV